MDGNRGRKQPFRRVRCRRRIVRLTGAALLFFAFAAAAGESAAARAERFDSLIESLNAPSDRRARALDAIHNELRGPDGREMQEVLREALSRSNTLILMGVVEAMAVQGDTRDVANLEALLATCDKLEVKCLVIRLLPAFCLQSERARFNFIRYAVGYERAPRPGVLEPLRRPPLTRRGRLDPALERLRGRVVRSLVAQFDPVGAALRYIDDILYSAAARATVTHFVGDALGNDPSRWALVWAAQGRGMELNAGNEVEEIRLTALTSLADMGAEGQPEVIEAFRLLRAAGGDLLQQAVFETMAIMCTTAFVGNAALADMNFAAEDKVEAESWRLRRYVSAANLAVFTAESAGQALAADLDTSVFATAAAALGAALSFPADSPDTEGMLAAARERGVALLEQMLLMPDITREKRAALALALGEIGTARAVSAIGSIIGSPYCAPELGIDGTRMAEAAIDALRIAATGGGNGNEDARVALLALLADTRVYPPLRAGTPPVGLAHMVLWRLQRLARSTDISLEPETWRQRLGW